MRNVLDINTTLKNRAIPAVDAIFRPAPQEPGREVEPKRSRNAQAEGKSDPTPTATETTTSSQITAKRSRSASG